MKDTKVTFRANGGSWTVSANGSDYKRIAGNETFVCVGSASGGVDVTGEFYNDNIVLQFEMNNPWMGSPWAAVGQAIGDSGWDNDRTNLGEGDDHVYTTTIYTDDDQYDFKTRVIRLSDTDTKNFEVYPDWWE
jgi:hypothetical protein